MRAALFTRNGVKKVRRSEGGKKDKMERRLTCVKGEVGEK